MITVHHLNHSRSQRVLWLLEELDLPYELVKYERDPRTLLAPATLRAIHPLGKSPVVTDGDITVAESGAIVEYLVDVAQGKLAPTPGTAEHRLYRYFLHYAEGSLMPLLLLKLICAKVQTDAPLLVRPVARVIAGQVGSKFLDPNLASHLSFLADHLAKHAWFAGDSFTAADVQMSFAVQGAIARAGTAVAPKVLDWAKRIEARPAYQRALERGGPFQLGL